MADDNADVRRGVYIPVMIEAVARRAHRLRRGGAAWTAGALLLYLGALGCSERTRGSRAATGTWLGGAPDELPQMLNREAPFRYPAALFRRRTQGNVLLRLFVDSGGAVVADSSSVAESSREPLLDSAALAGASLLTFRPARRRGVPIAVVLLFPVHFRHPEGPRLPGDSL